MFKGIADFINLIILAITRVTNAATFASNPFGAITGQSNDKGETEQGDTGTKTLPQETTPAQVPAPKTARTNRSLITVPEHINARFNDTGSPAWRNQPGGKHLGTDFGAPNGSAVYAPYNLHIVKLGAYHDEGRKGDYIIGTLDDGTEYYTGHLTAARVKPGDYVRAGTQIASIGYYNHTHIQLRVNGELTDFEQYEKTH
jgi:murein DD-endopeptidase MepM/ murein hydrolase activator NlpD